MDFFSLRAHVNSMLRAISGSPVIVLLFISKGRVNVTRRRVIARLQYSSCTKHQLAVAWLIVCFIYTRTASESTVYAKSAYNVAG